MGRWWRYKWITFHPSLTLVSCFPHRSRLQQTQFIHIHLALSGDTYNDFRIHHPFLWMLCSPLLFRISEPVTKRG
ncbi:hypothetical protein DRY74_18385 [Salmonella enterica subsp. enterica serovar Java]|nr:hypothetical protein [Salmonella enterica subsp. enterica serovar Java]